MTTPETNKAVIAGVLTVVLVITLVVVGEFLIRLWFVISSLPEGENGTIGLLWFPPFMFSPGSAFMIIALGGGAMGGTLHAIVSLSQHIADRDFDASWTVWYLTNPLVGAALATALLLVLQAGLVGTGGGMPPSSGSNLAGVAAAATLSGLFTRHALNKLKSVFDTIFGADTAPAEPPQLRDVTPDELPAGQPIDLTIVGTGFDAGTTVDVDGRSLKPATWTATTLVVTVPIDLLAPPREVPVLVQSGSGGISRAIKVTVV